MVPSVKFCPDVTVYINKYRLAGGSFMYTGVFIAEHETGSFAIYAFSAAEYYRRVMFGGYRLR